MIPESFKQDLLNRVDIVDVINARVPLKKAGANWSACCPFHSEKTPSFTVSPSKQFYHCFGCGEHGNAIGFLMEYAGLGYVDAVRELAESVGMKLPEYERRDGPAAKEAGPDLHEYMQRASQYYREQLKGSPRAIDYLKGRGLTGTIAARFGIGYAPDGWQNLENVVGNYADKALVECGLVIVNDEGRRYDRFRDRIMFPILNQRGMVIAFGGRVLDKGEPKYLNSPETPLFEKGRELYGLSQARNAIRAAGRAIVVEGYMDVVMLSQHGIEYAVATLGTATTPVHVQKLLRQSDEIVFCFDGDAAGRKAAWHALEVSLASLADQKTLKFLFLPSEHDPDSFVREHGREAFEAELATAQPLSAYLLSELRARNDLASLEGRSKLAHDAKPLLARVAAPALQLALLKAVAELAGMTQRELAKLAEIRSAAAWAERPAPPPREDRSRGLSDTRVERELARCILARPELAVELDIGLLDESRPEARTLTAVAVHCREHPEVRTAAGLIDPFAGTEHEGLLKALLGTLMEAEADPESVAVVFREGQSKLVERRKVVRLAELKRRIDAGDRSPEVCAEYARLAVTRPALTVPPETPSAVL